MREYALRSGIGLGPVLSAREIALIRGAGVERRFDTGSLLQQQDEPSNTLHLLLSGSVKTYLIHTDGLESVLRIHLAGSLIGLSALSSRGCCDASSVALCPSTASCIRRADFLRLVETHPELGIKLMHLLVDRLSDLHFRMTELQTRSVEHRLAYALLSLSRPDPHADGAAGNRISLTHEELAQLINTRRQTVTTILGRFAQAGLIERSVRCIDVVDAPALAQRCGRMEADRAGSG